VEAGHRLHTNFTSSTQQEYHEDEDTLWIILAHRVTSGVTFDEWEQLTVTVTDTNYIEAFTVWLLEENSIQFCTAGGRDLGL
jgi:hypothetical protein